MRKLSESVWKDIRQKSLGNEVRKEMEFTKDDRNILEETKAIKKFADKVFYWEHYDNTCDDFMKFVNSKIGYYSRINLPRFTRMHNQFQSMCDKIRPNWDAGEKLHDLIQSEIDKEDKYVTGLGFKKVPDEPIAETVNNWWNDLDDKEKRFILYDIPKFGDEDRADYNDMWDGISYAEQVKTYIEYNQ